MGYNLMWNNVVFSCVDKIHKKTKLVSALHFNLDGTGFIKSLEHGIKYNQEAIKNYQETLNQHYDTLNELKDYCLSSTSIEDKAMYTKKLTQTERTILNVSANIKYCEQRLAHLKAHKIKPLVFQSKRDAYIWLLLHSSFPKFVEYLAYNPSISEETLEKIIVKGKYTLKKYSVRTSQSDSAYAVCLDNVFLTEILLIPEKTS